MLAGLFGIPATVIALMWKVEIKMSKIGHGGRVIVFGKSSVKQGQIEGMKGKYFHDISIVRAGGEST
jgi:hypothetical protein